MIPRRTLSRLIATLLAFAVLFAQTAALAYACQKDTPGNAPAAVAPCPEHIDDSADSRTGGSANLCKIHCETPASSDSASVVAATPVAAAQTYLLRSVNGYAVPTTPPEPHGAPPPLILRTSRFLI